MVVEDEIVLFKDEMWYCDAKSTVHVSGKDQRGEDTIQEIVSRHTASLADCKRPTHKWPTDRPTIMADF